MPPILPFAYCTIVTTEDYIIGAQTLSKSLKRFTKYPLVAIASKHIDYQQLMPYFDLVVPVEPIMSKDSRIALIDRPLQSTFTKFYAWTLDFQKVVYLDSDMIVLESIDDLFKQPQLSASPDVGWPDCFNSGLMVLEPNYVTFEELRYQAVEFGSFDGADQGLLNDYFKDWNRLPFAYNCTVSVAPVYSYKPAYLHYKDTVKVLHYFGAAKPWNHLHSSVDIINELLEKWWAIQKGNHAHDTQNVNKQRKLSYPSRYNENDEPSALTPTTRTVIINNHEYIVDNNQDIPFNPNHQQYHPENDNRQKNFNEGNMSHFANYRCDWDEGELYGEQKSTKVEKSSVFKVNSWVDMKKMKEIAVQQDLEEERANIMDLSNDNLKK